MHAKAILALLLAGLLVVFTAQNVEVVDVRFLFWKLEMSRALVLFGVLAIGVLIGWLLSSLGRRAHKP